MKADTFFAAIDERQERELAQFPGAAGTGLCASCGKHPPMDGFNMCVACRVKAHLPVDAKSLAEFRARAAAETAAHAKAHADFAARQKEKSMFDITPIPTETCPDCGKTGILRMAMHKHHCPALKSTGGGTPMPAQPETTPPVGETTADYSETIPAESGTIEPTALDAMMADTDGDGHSAFEASDVSKQLAADSLPDLPDGPLCHVSPIYPVHVEHVVVEVHLDLSGDDTTYRDELIDLLWRDAYSDDLPDTAKRALGRLVQLAKEG